MTSYDDTGRTYRMSSIPVNVGVARRHLQRFSIPKFLVASREDRTIVMREGPRHSKTQYRVNKVATYTLLPLEPPSLLLITPPGPPPRQGFSGVPSIPFFHREVAALVHGSRCGWCMAVVSDKVVFRTAFNRLSSSIVVRDSRRPHLHASHLEDRHGLCRTGTWLNGLRNRAT